MTQLISTNPATGETLKTLTCTEVSELPRIFADARTAQSHWDHVPVEKRARQLLNLRETLIDQSDAIAELIHKENGKPLVEALGNELVPSADSLTYFAKNSAKILRDHPLSLTLLKHRKSYINHWPVGVVAIISPWNYPFLLPFVEILMAVVAGNSVVFKPSEVTPLVGLKIKELFDDSGFPVNLVQCLVGDGSLGAAIIEEKPAKLFFTGSVATGKKIMSAAAKHLIPVNLELGGKDPMIVLQDADLDYATSAALWGGFSNAGQMCASTERLILHEKIAEPFLELLKDKIAQLRQTGPEIDLGPITLEKQKDVYQRQINEAKTQGARFLSGGEFSADRRHLLPTLISGEGIEKLSIYREETFGPMIAATTFKTVPEAIQKANDTPYGLLASIITKNISLAEQIAKQLEVGSVLINEVAYTAGLTETPWGGVKDSGIGRSHSDIGLKEFVNVRHIHKPRSSLFIFKSLWWFPYGPNQRLVFRQLLNLYRRQWVDKLRAFPHFLWSFVQFLKNERRL